MKPEAGHVKHCAGEMKSINKVGVGFFLQRFRNEMKDIAKEGDI